MSIREDFLTTLQTEVVCVIIISASPLPFRSDRYALSLPCQVITIPPHATAAVLSLSDHLVHVQVCSSLAFPRSFAALNSILVKQRYSNNLQSEVSFLVAVPMLLKLLQYATSSFVVFPIIE
jgi:hypothetical protein